MRIAVVGCGAMGSIYAALLADGGHEVVAVHRGKAHVDAINASGLRVEGASGDRTVRIQARTSPLEAAVDLVVLAVKAAHVGAAAANFGGMVGPETVVLAIQNGVGSADELVSHVDPDRLCIGIAAAFGAIMRAPGHVHHNGMNMIRMGAHAGMSKVRVEGVAAVWRAAGFKAEAVEDVVAMQWEKLICNVAYSAPCALAGMTVGELMDDADMGPISRAAATEAWVVAKALGIAIAVEDPIAHVRAFAASMPNARPSLLQDVEAGRPSEIGVINGAISRFGGKVGVSAPVNETLSSLIRQRERAYIRT